MSHLVSDTKDAAKPMAALRRRRFGKSSSYFGRASFSVLYVKNLQVVAQAPLNPGPATGLATVAACIVL